MKKTILSFMLMSSFSFAQVGINTTTPNKTLHVNGSLQLTNELNIGGDGKKLGDPGEKGQILISNGPNKAPAWKNEINLGETKSTFLYLTKDQNDFLKNAKNGDLQTIPDFGIIVNGAEGVTYDESSSTFTFNKSGVFKFSFTYEALHNAACTLSSYFIDFVNYNKSKVRIHTTAQHNEKGASNHGGTISYVSRISAGTTWKIQLGRGQSGNCSGSGMTLIKESTVLEITSIKN